MIFDNQIEVTHADVSHCCLLNSGVPVRAVFLEPLEPMRSQMMKKPREATSRRSGKKHKRRQSAQAFSGVFDTTIEGFDPGS